MSASFATYHASQRAFERYHVFADRSVWRQVVVDITDTIMGIRSSAVLLRRWPVRELWLVHVGGVAIVLIWDRTLAMVVTVLPSGKIRR